MSNDIVTSSNDTNLNDQEDELPAAHSESEKNNIQTEDSGESEIVKNRVNTVRTVLIYALFLFVKISCFIFINANLIFFLTYLFERIYYKTFTLGNMDKKKTNGG